MEDEEQARQFSPRDGLKHVSLRFDLAEKFGKRPEAREFSPRDVRVPPEYDERRAEFDRRGEPGRDQRFAERPREGHGDYHAPPRPPYKRY